MKSVKHCNGKTTDTPNPQLLCPDFKKLKVIRCEECESKPAKRFAMVWDIISPLVVEPQKQPVVWLVFHKPKPKTNHGCRQVVASMRPNRGEKADDNARNVFKGRRLMGETPWVKRDSVVPCRIKTPRTTQTVKRPLNPARGERRLKGNFHAGRTERRPTAPPTHPDGRMQKDA